MTLARATVGAFLFAPAARVEVRHKALGILELTGHPISQHP